MVNGAPLLMRAFTSTVSPSREEDSSRFPSSTSEYCENTNRADGFHLGLEHCNFFHLIINRSSEVACINTITTDTHLHWAAPAPLSVVQSVGALHGRGDHRSAVDCDGVVDVLGPGHLNLQKSHILLTSRLFVDLKPESKT